MCCHQILTRTYWPDTNILGPFVMAKKIHAVKLQNRDLRRKLKKISASIICTSLFPCLRGIRNLSSKFQATYLSLLNNDSWLKNKMLQSFESSCVEFIPTLFDNFFTTTVLFFWTALNKRQYNLGKKHHHHFRFHDIA